MTIAALVLWIVTGAVGSYLLATSVRAGSSTPAVEPAPAEPVPARAVRDRAVRDRDRFDPPSLQRAKSEPWPGLRELAEFAHPALAIIGFAFWFGFVLSHDRLFLAIGLGVLLGTIAAGVTWFTASTRAARRAATGATTVSSRLLILHAVGATLTLLLTALIAARV